MSLINCLHDVVESGCASNSIVGLRSVSAWLAHWTNLMSHWMKSLRMFNRSTRLAKPNTEGCQKEKHSVQRRFRHGFQDIKTYQYIAAIDTWTTINWIPNCWLMVVPWANWFETGRSRKSSSKLCWPCGESPPLTSFQMIFARRIAGASSSSSLPVTSRWKFPEMWLPPVIIFIIHF